MTPSVHPWCKKKRWAAAVALWLAVAYPASVGPISYAEGRGWLPPLPPAALVTFCRPIRYYIENRLPLTDLIKAYGGWCKTRGQEARRASD